MTFNDIFKSGFLENVNSISLLDMGIALVLSFCLGLFIFLIYKKTFNGVMYSSSFGVTLLALTMITTVVILAVTSNVVLSLGMVGALSIVRFRTAIKEPLDIAFLFWSIAVGIVLASGMIPLAVIGSVVIGLVLLVFVNKRSYTNPYILVVQCDGQDAEQQAEAYLEQQVQRCVVKSKTVQKGAIELNLEIRMKGDDTGFVNTLSEFPGVHSAVLVSYNGDYTGITKAGNSHLRKLLVEAAQTFSRSATKSGKSAALKERQAKCDSVVVAYADKANERLKRKYFRISMRSKSNIAKAAVARELACFIWGLMTDHIA